MDAMGEKAGSVLLVDDDNMTRVVYSRCLKGAGYDVVSVESGAAALSLLEARSFDVMLLDNVMPGLTGVQLLERLPSIPPTHKPRVVMLSGTEDSSLVERCKSLGADEVLVKPVTPGRLRAAVRESIDAGAASAR